MSVHKQLFKKQPKKQQPKIGFFQSVSSVWTNFRYSSKKVFNQISQSFFQSSQNTQNKIIFIQGKRYNNRKQAKQVIKKILWFSYRKNLNTNSDYKSDVGWGCLIRVGQMALSSAIIKYFTNLNKKIGIQKEFQVDSQNFIPAFIDIEGKIQKYSLNKIIKIAEEQYKQKPGQWFNLSQIGFCLQKLHNKYPMKGSQALKIIAFDQVLNISTIFKLQNLPLCRCAKKNVACILCHSEYVVNNKQKISPFSKNSQGQYLSYATQGQISNSISQINMKKGGQKLSLANHSIKQVPIKNENKNFQMFKNSTFKKDLTIFLLTKTNNSQPKLSQNIDRAIFELIDLKYFIGIMTGFPGRAIFVVGRQNNKLIYLDPHYVQQNHDLGQLNLQSYSCQQYLTCDRNELDPFMSFCFYIQTVKQLQHLTHTINEIIYKYPDCLSIAVDFSSSYFDQNDYKQDVQEDQFSQLSDFSKFDL